jgi:cysteinyl-tRNA synthetase
MKIYNTLTKQLETLPEPSEQKKINMFVCGPTVYDYIHIGNARTFVIFDVVAKYLKHKGYDVHYIQNITDIDNKIIERAQKEGVDPLEYAKKFTDIFKQDMTALGVTAPEYKNATDHIGEVIKQVQTLLDKGNAYVIENDPDASVGAGGIYFDLSTFPDYGKLSGRTAGMANDAVSRIDDSDKKRNRGDFAIWKFSQPGDPTEILGGLKHRQETIPSWPAPFGAGRPGWHIEDTAITEKYFGPQYDIHGGGEDLKFPHHEAEIALEESASGKKPFVKYWMHAGFLVNKSEKMSKSGGNFQTLHKVLDKYSPEALRFYFLSAHYRSPLAFDEQALKSAEAAISRIREFDAKTREYGDSSQLAQDLIVKLGRLCNSITNALDNDFNTPEAIGFFFEIIKELNKSFSAGMDIVKIQEFRTIYRIVDILGIKSTKKQEIPAEISKLAEQREEARKNKDWTKADEFRSKIESNGYRIDDTPYGPFISILF